MPLWVIIIIFESLNLVEVVGDKSLKIATKYHYPVLTFPFQFLQSWITGTRMWLLKYVIKLQAQKSPKSESITGYSNF